MIIIPNLQMKKRRLREVKGLTQGHTVQKQKAWDLNSEYPTPVLGSLCTLECVCVQVCVCIRMCVVRVGVFLGLYSPRAGHKGSASAGIIVHVRRTG